MLIGFETKSRMPQSTGNLYCLTKGLLAALALINVAVATAGAVEDKFLELTEQIVVIGERNTIPGSGTIISKIDLDRFDHIDVNQVLSSVPGIYVREEEGYGLRPNIGIRGAAAERSQKITLLEDGIPVAPAVYSAPAAYYVPNISRAHAVEVLKGPSAIQYGPHTVGGAINFITSPIPPTRRAELDLSLGTAAFYKPIAIYGDANEHKGFLIEALRYGSDGFKELDGGGDTGFVRNDLGSKLFWTPSTAHRITLRVGYTDENANETYLGLTDADFAAVPNRRYRASQHGRFQSERVGAHLNYDSKVGVVHLNAKAYWHRFERAWNKLDGFISGHSLSSILAAPHRFAQEYALLTGDMDSLATDLQTLDVTNNDRAYNSHGVQTTGVAEGAMGQARYRLTAGVRLHRDSVEREHKPRGYLMQSGNLVWDGIIRPPKVLNRAGTTAVALFASKELTWRNTTLSLGIRHENIDGEREDFINGTALESTQKIYSPGVGLHWPVSSSLSALAGVYRGWSPAGPGSQDVEPERSLNYEYGLRYYTELFSAELVGFFSDYENLLGRCRVSDFGCQAGDEFNAGEVEIAGAELTADLVRNLMPALSLEVQLAYTYTESAFQNSFLSGFSQWGLVRQGDKLPYLPAHRTYLSIGLTSDAWDVFAALKHHSPMREEPGFDAIEDDLHTDGLTTLAISGTWRIRESTRLQFVASNITNEVTVVSHRPFGARPNRPRWFTVRIRQSFQ